MKIILAFSVLLSSLAAVGCTNRHSNDNSDDNFRISAPDKVEAGEAATVSVSGTVDGGVKFLWTASTGRIDGANDNLTATFVASSAGPATVACTIMRPGHKTIALDKQIEVIGRDNAAAAVPPATPAVPQAPAGQPGAPLQIEDHGFVPSGWMGDHEGLTVDPKSMARPLSGTYSQKWTFLPTGKDKDLTWAAVAWQYGDNNWGDRPGANLAGHGFHQVSVWARGVKDSAGILPKLQFKAGGGTRSVNAASFEVVGDFVPLTEDWKQYTLDLRGKDLSRVVTAFVFVVRAKDVGPKGTTFYLDDIEYQ